MRATAAKQTIAVDIDDVLASHADELIRFSNQRWGTDLTIEDYDEHWSKMWQIDRHEVEQRAQELFRDLPDFKHIPDAFEVLTRLSNKYKLVILTSRRREISQETEAWLKKNYPGIFEEIHYSGIWERKLADPDIENLHTKGDVATAISAEYLIDDQPKHCLAAAESGLTGLLFGDYPWNRNQKPHKGIVRVRTWTEVEEFFNAQDR